MDTSGSSWELVAGSVKLPPLVERSRRLNVANFWRSLGRGLPWIKLAHLTTSTYDADASVFLW